MEGSPLSQEQRMRMQRNREQAIANRNARLSRCPQDLSPCSYAQRNPASEVPEVIELGDSDHEVTEAQGSRFRYFRAAPLVETKPKRMISANQGSTQTDSSKKDEKITLSTEQLRVLEAVAAKKSVFVTGSAGTGKSFIIEYAIKVLRNLYNHGVFVTASTGLAAFALGGTTLHSFSGVGLGTYSKERLYGIVIRDKDKARRWREAAALVIDEISMIEAELFDKIDYVGQKVRNSTAPFGGLQLLVTGDFFQLPPVQKPGESKAFAFAAECWNRCFDLQVELTHVFRQSEGEFVDILNEIRRGKCSPQTTQRLLACTNLKTDDGIAPTRLYPRKADVDEENEGELKALGTELVTFESQDYGRVEALKYARAARVVRLAVGAQVMLIKNLQPCLKLVNGSRGVVVGFLPPDKVMRSDMGSSPLPVVRFEGGIDRVVTPETWSVMDGETKIASRVQIPLILAWALSVHKCQGMTLDRVQTDLSRSFEYGMVYVALSRVRSLKGLKLLGFDPTKIKVHPQVVRFYEQLKTNC